MVKKRRTSADILNGATPKKRKGGTPMEGLSAAQFQTNYTFGLMKMAMRDAEAQAQEMIEMMSEVAAPAQYNFDVRV